MPTSYLEQSQLLTDPEWGARVDACVRQEALKFVDDERPEFTILANAILADPLNLPTSVRSMVAGAPTDPAQSLDATDEVILNGVDYVWPRIGGAMVGAGSS